MAIRILTSIQDDFGYYNNVAYLQKGLLDGRFQFQGFVNNHATEAIVFDNKARVYDFTRSAHSNDREDMTTYLAGVLLSCFFRIAAIDLTVYPIRRICFSELDC